MLEAAVDRSGRDDGRMRPAVQTAATALEGLLQAVAEPSVSGENLAIVFSVWDPTPLRTAGLGTKVYESCPVHRIGVRSADWIMIRPKALTCYVCCLIG